MDARKAPIVVDLPPNIEREIGRVITRYANLEHRLNILLYLLLDVPSSFGRLAVREPRATDRFDLAHELLELHEIVIGDIDLDVVRQAIEQAMNQRDQLAHSVWVRDPENGQLHLRLTRGAWQPVEGQRGKTKRAILPETVLYGVADCRSLRKLIRATLGEIEHIAREAEKAMQRSSRRRFDPQRRLINRLRGHKTKARAGRREP